MWGSLLIVHCRVLPVNNKTLSQSTFFRCQQNTLQNYIHMCTFHILCMRAASNFKRKNVQHVMGGKCLLPKKCNGLKTMHTFVPLHLHCIRALFIAHEILLKQGNFTYLYMYIVCVYYRAHTKYDAKVMFSEFLSFCPQGGGG